MKEIKKRVILIGAGELYGSFAESIRSNLTKEDYVIALDGGLSFCAEHGIIPDRIVGDFDSLPACKKDLLAQYPEQIINRLPCEKDDTDTLAAIRMAVQMGFKNFLIYGGLGGRLSHTMANIQSLLFLKENGLYGELAGDGSRVYLVKEESITLPLQKEGYISIFAYSKKAEGVTLKNLKYEVQNIDLFRSYPIGVSNEFIGQPAEISVTKGILLVVEEQKE